MKRKEKKVFENVVVDNFMFYLKKKGITQKKYSIDNNLDESIVSKWKKGKSSMTIDQIRQAANYFEITFNDLMYSEDEKRRIEVLLDRSYKPITAQHSIDVEIYDEIFKKPVRLLIRVLISLVVVSLLMYVFRDVSIFSPLVVVFFVFLVNKEIRKSSIREENFIISYLDDIFYERKEGKNAFFFYTILIKGLSILAILYIMIQATKIPDRTDISYGLSITLLLLAILQFFLITSSFTETPRHFKSSIYEEDFRPYTSLRLSIIVYASLLSVSVMYIIYDFSDYYLLFIACVILFVINAFDFSKLSMEYSKYSLIYKENNKKTRQLYPNKN